MSESSQARRLLPVRTAACHRRPAIVGWGAAPAPLLPAIIRERLAEEVVAELIGADGNPLCVRACDLGADFWARNGLEGRAPVALLNQARRFLKSHAGQVAPWPAFEQSQAHDIALETLPITVRTFNATRFEGWTRIADLSGLTFRDLQRTPNLGTHSILDLTCCVEAALVLRVVPRPTNAPPQTIKGWMACFSDREWRLLESRVLPCKPLQTLAALAREFGVSSGRIGQIEGAACRRLRKLFHQELGAVLCRFALALRRECGDAVAQAELTERLEECPGMRELQGIWRERLQQLVLWMAGPYVLREGWWVYYPAPPRRGQTPDS